LKFKKGDLAVVLILILTVTGWLARDLLWPNTEDKVAVIGVNGQEYQKVPLTTGNGKREIPVNLPNNQYVLIVQENQTIYVKDASCPDKVCEKTGKISENGQNIVCLPNKVVIHIEGTDTTNVDDLAF